MNKPLPLFASVVAVVCLFSASSAQAQPPRHIRWQLQPFCNRVTINVTQNGAVYTFDGLDFQCGGSNPRAPLVGTGTVTRRHHRFRPQHRHRSRTETQLRATRRGSGGFRQTRAFIGGVRGVATGVASPIAVLIDSNGQLGTQSSSRRSKTDIEGLSAEVGLKLHALRPVQFHYKQAPADGANPLE